VNTKENPVVMLPGAKLGAVEDLEPAQKAGQSLPAVATKSRRIPALDFTKGALVMIMVLYHWLNYFLGPSDNRYLRFLTPSFIFITGFLISNVSFSRYGTSDPKLPRRLLQRGLKILGVFALLNLLRVVLFADSYRAQMLAAHSSIRNLLEIYVTGSGVGGGQGRAIAFFILVPIAYLLMLSALLSIAARAYRNVFPVACAVFFLSIAILHLRGYQSPNLELLTIGLLGAAVGYIPIQNINAQVRRPYGIAVAYLGYLAANNVWNVIYPLQVVGVCLSVTIIYVLGNPYGEPGQLRGLFVLLGKYSLFGYIAQIAMLQVLRRGMQHIESEAVVLPLSFILAVVLTIASVEILHWTRAQSLTVDRAYKAVFA
jgi:hypothetical protein